MVFSDLPVGSMFAFGHVEKRNTRYHDGRRIAETITVPMMWKKTQNGQAVCVENQPFASFDYARAETGANRYERTHGQRIFFQSSLFKFLNCDNASWRVTDPGDNAPYSEHDSGFLSRFTQDERAFMQPFSMTVAVPPGYTKRFGTSITQEVLVGIPSATQVGSRFSSGSFGIMLNEYDTWLADADSLSCRMRYGYTNRTGGDNAAHVMAVVTIKPDAPIDHLANGTLIIRVPETDFTGNLSEFLGLEMAA